MGLFQSRLYFHFVSPCRQIRNTPYTLLRKAQFADAAKLERHPRGLPPPSPRAARVRGNVRAASYILGPGSIQIRRRPYPCQRPSYPYEHAAPATPQPPRPEAHLM